MNSWRNGYCYSFCSVINIETSGGWYKSSPHMLFIRIGEEIVLKIIALSGVQGSNPWDSVERRERNEDK